MARRPTVGLLGLTATQGDRELAEHHEGYLAQVGRRLATVADVVSGVPLGSGVELATALSELARVGVDGIVLVTLGAVLPDGYGPALASLGAPLLIANLQPERTVGEDWSDYDLSFNAGLGAAEELANHCVTAGIGFAALTGDWLSERFTTRFEQWARAAGAARAVAGELQRDDALERIAAALLDQPHCLAGMRAMDWNRDAIMILPSPGFAAAPGPFTAAALTCLPGGELRLCVGSGQLLGEAQQPQIEQPHLLFAPDAGLEDFMNAWLASGSPRECVIAAGEHGEHWRRLAELLEIEYEEI